MTLIYKLGLNHINGFKQKAQTFLHDTKRKECQSDLNQQMKRRTPSHHPLHIMSTVIYSKLPSLIRPCFSIHPRENNKQKYCIILPSLKKILR